LVNFEERPNSDQEEPIRHAFFRAEPLGVLIKQIRCARNSGFNGPFICAVIGTMFPWLACNLEDDFTVLRRLPSGIIGSLDVRAAANGSAAQAFS
jgi:hypothetical protein